MLWYIIYVNLCFQGLGKKRATLYDIRDELFEPYKDRRPQFASMELEEQFSLLTGETPGSINNNLASNYWGTIPRPNGVAPITLMI